MLQRALIIYLYIHFGFLVPSSCAEEWQPELQLGIQRKENIRWQDYQQIIHRQYYPLQNRVNTTVKHGPKIYHENDLPLEEKNRHKRDRVRQQNRPIIEHAVVKQQLQQFVSKHGHLPHTIFVQNQEHLPPTTHFVGIEGLVQSVVNSIGNDSQPELKKKQNNYMLGKIIGNQINSLVQQEEVQQNRYAPPIEQKLIQLNQDQLQIPAQQNKNQPDIIESINVVDQLQTLLENPRIQNIQPSQQLETQMAVQKITETQGEQQREPVVMPQNHHLGEWALKVVNGLEQLLEGQQNEAWTSNQHGQAVPQNPYPLPNQQTPQQQQVLVPPNQQQVLVPPNQQQVLVPPVNMNTMAPFWYQQNPMGNLNPANLNPANLNPPYLNPENLNPTNPNPMNFNPTNLNPSNPNPQYLNPANLNPANLNPPYLNPENLNPTNPNPMNFNPTNLNPSNLNPQYLNSANLNPTNLNHPYVNLNLNLNLNPANLNPVNLNPINPNPMNLNPANLNPANLNPTNPNPTNLNPANPNPSDLNPVNPNPMEPIENDMAETPKTMSGKSTVWVIVGYISAAIAFIQAYLQFEAWEQIYSTNIILEESERHLAHISSKVGLLFADADHLQFLRDRWEDSFLHFIERERIIVQIQHKVSRVEFLYFETIKFLADVKITLTNVLDGLAVYQRQQITNGLINIILFILNTIQLFSDGLSLYQGAITTGFVALPVGNAAFSFIVRRYIIILRDIIQAVIEMELQLEAIQVQLQDTQDWLEFTLGGHFGYGYGHRGYKPAGINLSNNSPLSGTFNYGGFSFGGGGPAGSTPAEKPTEKPAEKPKEKPGRWDPAVMMNNAPAQSTRPATIIMV